LAQFGLTVEQSMILSLLTNRGRSATPKMIEEFTMRQYNSISALINRMIRMNLVSKRKIPQSKKLKSLSPGMERTCIIKCLPSAEQRSPFSCNGRIKPTRIIHFKREPDRNDYNLNQGIELSVLLIMSFCSAVVSSIK
jgi:hypothetical protein